MAVDYKELKKGGFMRQVQKDTFALRIKVTGGQIESDKLKKVYELSEKYGKGYVHMTSRQSIEIPFIKLEDVEAIKKELDEAGLQPGACGPRVRTITSCQGNAICSGGLIETNELAKEFDKRYYARELPHKFKIGITGCRNNCLKAEENDLGVKGGMRPTWEESLCTFCTLCKQVCPTKAISEVDRKAKVLTFEEDKCVYCGKCVKVCPVEAWAGEGGFILYFGGTFGNRIVIGKQLLPILFDKDQVHKAIEIALQFFAKHGKASERFAATLDRVGWELLENELKEVIA